MGAHQFLIVLPAQVLATSDSRKPRSVRLAIQSSCQSRTLEFDASNTDICGCKDGPGAYLLNISIDIHSPESVPVRKIVRMQDLFLDKAILHWVLIPITLGMVRIFLTGEIEVQSSNPHSTDSSGSAPTLCHSVTRLSSQTSTSSTT